MDKIYQDKEFFPAGLRGSTTIQLENVIKENLDYFYKSFESLESLYDFKTASGDNLRRIGALFGFSLSTDNDDVFKKYFLLFLMTKKTNGSISYIYDIFKILEPEHYRNIDAWQNFKNVDQIIVVVFENGVGKLLPNNVITIIEGDSPSFFEGFVDFHLENDVDSWDTAYQDYVKALRFIGRRVLAIEVYEVFYE